MHVSRRVFLLSGRESRNSKSNNAGTHATFAKFSQIFCKFFEVFVGSETCLALFGPSWMRSDVRMHSEAFGSVRTFSETFALVPNTGEANDEALASMALIISEMCALRLENNYRLCR